MIHGMPADQMTGHILILPLETRVKSKKRKRKEYCYFPDGPSDSAYAEHALWKAVLVQAIVDACGAAYRPKQMQEKLEAIHWLMSGGADFVEVCQRAGLEPSVVRLKAKRAMANPQGWHTPAGDSWRYDSRRTVRRRRKQERKELENIPQHGCVIYNIFA